MSERIGLLFSDHSMLLFPEGTDVETAQEEAEEHDLGGDGDPTQIVRLRLAILEIIMAP